MAAFKHVARLAMCVHVWVCVSCVMFTIIGVDWGREFTGPNYMTIGWRNVIVALVGCVMGMESFRVVLRGSIPIRRFDMVWRGIDVWKGVTLIFARCVSG